MENEGDTNVTRGFKVSGMPMKQWFDWEKSAIVDFGNCYWLKIWSDHDKAKNFDIIINSLIRRIEEIEGYLDELSSEEPEEKKEEKKEVRTLGR